MVSIMAEIYFSDFCKLLKILDKLFFKAKIKLNYKPEPTLVTLKGPS